MDVLGDLGGLTECFMLVFGFFLKPVSEHSFTLQATKRLFVAKTNTADLLLPHNVKEERIKMSSHLRKLEEENSKK